MDTENGRAARSVSLSRLKRHGIEPKKSLGQKFCVDDALLERIAEAADIGGAAVVEIGAGLGALTEPLLRRAGSVLAVETDARLCAVLESECASEKLTVVKADFLRMDAGLLPKPFHAVGNLPYYITTPILERLALLLPRSMTLMLQKEAEARLFAAPGDRVYGALPALLTLCYRAERLFDVPRSAYEPAPTVDSAVARLVLRPDAPGDVRPLLRFLNRAFAMRRKTLPNNLGRGILPALENIGVSPDVRAEALTPAQLYALYQICTIQEALNP